MASPLSRVTRAKSETKRKTDFTWSQAAIDIRCRIFLQEIDWPWIDLERHEFLTPVEEYHLVNGYAGIKDNLCRACLQLDLKEDTYQPNGTSLAIAASEGCQLCSMVLESFLVHRPDNMGVLLEHPDPIKLHLVDVAGRRAVRARYAGKIYLNGEDRFVIAHKDLPVLTESAIELLPGKANTIEFIGKKMNECMTSHERCTSGLLQPLPHRLIDVGCPGGEEIHQPRLWINPRNERALETGDTGSPCGVYAALSYCWGDISFFNLTPENHGDLPNGFAVDRLPQTLQDAIEITRGLGIQYLWVDALCIIQGQSAEAKEDWARQSIQMDTVFSNAAVVLGVAGSSHPFDGIGYWPYRFRDLVEINAVQHKTGPSRQHTIQPGRCFIASEEIVEEDTLGVLHTRGWTFQERILATRFIHLGKEKVFFECNHGRQYQGYKEDPFRLHLCKRLDPSPRFDSWHELVVEYSKRQLTVPTDRLIAISGVAKRFAPSIGLAGRYLAGMWEDNLIYDLLWCTESPSPRISSAPSWSWASNNSEISYERIRRHFCNPSCAKIIDTDVTDFPAMYGFRSTGSIRVKGYLRKIFIRGEQDRYHIVGFQAPRAQVEHQEARQRIGLCLMDSPSVASSIKPVAERFQDDNTALWENIFESWCLELHLGRGILLKLADETGKQFERIGYFEYREHRAHGNTMLWDERACNRNPVAQAAYLAEHPFQWMSDAMDAGQEDLVEDWFGDPDAVVTLV